MNSEIVAQPEPTALDQVAATFNKSPMLMHAARLLPFLQKDLAENVVAIDSDLVLPMRSIFGTRSLTVAIDRPSPWIARVYDAQVNAACGYIFQAHDLMAVLDRFPGVTWRRHAEPDTHLEIFAVDTQSFVESLAVLRDACAAILAAAWGMSVMDDSLRAELPEPAVDRFTEAVRVHRFQAAQRLPVAGGAR